MWGKNKIFLIYCIVYFLSLITITCSVKGNEVITVASGDQITLILNDELVDCVYTILIISDQIISGNFTEIISFKGKIFGELEYECTNLDKCNVDYEIIDGNSVINVNLLNITLNPEKFWYVKLLYTIDDLLNYSNGIWNFNYLFTSTGKSVEIVIKVPKESHQFEEVRFTDVIPIPDSFYEEKSYYVFTWKYPTTIFKETTKYYIDISYETIIATTSVMNFVINILFTIIISLISATTWNYLNKPKLDMQIIPFSDEEPAIQIVGEGKRAFYHLKVINRGRTSVYDCEIHLKFLNLDKIELFKIKGKWDRSPEPLIPLSFQMGTHSPKIIIQEYPNSSLIPFSEILNIRPNIPDNFCLIMKYNDEKECYGFSAWNYLKGYNNGLRVNDWKIGIGKFIVEIEVRGANAHKSAKFFVENNGTNILDVKITRAKTD